MTCKRSPREIVQIVAALRYWGRALEMSLPEAQPHLHPMVRDRFKGHLPLALDELETLIGRLDGSLESKGRRPWNPEKYL